MCVNEFSLPVLSGIIASIISIAIISFLNQFWKKIVLNWYEELLYKGAEISGKWHSLTTYHNGDKNEIVYYIKRKGYSVSGKAICVSGPDKGLEWMLRGSFKNLTLTVTYESVNPKEIERGSSTLRLIENGKRFRGHLLYYTEDKNEIESTAFELFRLEGGATTAEYANAIPVYENR